VERSNQKQPKMKTLADCEKFIDRVGMATVLPGKSPFTCLLWEAQGHQGSFSGDDPAFQNIWNWKDELPAKKLAFAGRLLGEQVLLVHRRLLPALLGLRGPVDADFMYEDGLLQRDAFRLWQILKSAENPLGRKELRRQLALSDKSGASAFDRACKELESRLVMTRSGSAAMASGWDSNAYTLVERHFSDIAPLPRKDSLSLVEQALRDAAPAATEVQLQRWMKRLGAG
jgi:hypothetical protein